MGNSIIGMRPPVASQLKCNPLGGALNNQPAVPLARLLLRNRVACWLHYLADRVSHRPSATKPDSALLDALVDHIAHEIAAMEASAVLWHKTSAWIALEDFLLHARLLREFIWKTYDPRDKYAASAVCAEHFHPPWRHSSGGPPKCFRRTKEAMDKQLAHIARERVTNPYDLANEVDELRTALWSAWKRFLAQLGSDPRSNKFKVALRERCNKLAITLPAGAT